ncbi:shikimate kinase [Flavobacterium sp.]
MTNKIVLIGYMGVGKTTIGKELAKKTNLEYLDLDQLIEKAENQTIDELFRAKGELYFRKLEHQLFKELLGTKNQFVLSTGGGTPCYYNNYLYLENANVTAVYLQASIDTLYNRLCNEKLQRPLVQDLSTADLKEFIGKHLFERSFYYQKANYKIKVDNKSVNQIVQQLVEQLF